MTRKRLAVVTLALFALLVTFLVGGAATRNPDQGAPGVIYRGELQVVNFDVSPRLDEIEPTTIDFRSAFEIFDDLPMDLFQTTAGIQDADAALQTAVGGGVMPSPSITFAGPTNTFGVTPPDPNGAVGPNHVVMISNLTFGVYSKTGQVLYGPVPNNSIWSGFGGACGAFNDGDPIVVYDQFTDRWLITQFTGQINSTYPTYKECVALSTTGDPTGPYYRWAIDTGANFPDYPKVGVGADGYYFSTREFSGSNFSVFEGIGAYAMNKSQMVAGNANPTILSFLAAFGDGSTAYNTGDGLLPADIDGNALPPAGSPHYFVGTMDNGSWTGAPQDALTLWHFDADWATPGNSSFTLEATLPIAAFDTIFPCDFDNSRSCIPQKDTSKKVDILSSRQRPMFRLAYRNFGTHEALVTNQSIDAGSSIAGIRWWEIRDPNGTPGVYQEGTFAPGLSDGVHRWMGSIAMDASGNMALGYSASSSTLHPSIWYTGRLVTDTLGTLPQGEGVIVNGTGAQTTSNRWGDYTSMAIDPVDDCTFWYTNQWLPGDGNAWELRIGAFKFESCGKAKISVEPEPLISVLGPDAFTTRTLRIENTATYTLSWSINEANSLAPIFSPDQPSNTSSIPGAAREDAGFEPAASSPDAPAVPSGWAWPSTNVLVDNGPLITCAGCGSGGADVSELDQSSGMNTLGFGNQAAPSSGNWIADDFAVAGPNGWLVDKATFFGYQTGSTTASTFTDINWRLYDGEPGSDGSIVYSGSGLQSTGWTSIYRSVGITRTNRPIMFNEVDMGNLYLPPGSYWLSWQADGTEISGPWVPPITVSGMLTTGNGLQDLGDTGVFSPTLDSGSVTQQGLPFVLQGTVIDACPGLSDIPWLSLNKTSGFTPGGQISEIVVTFDSTGLSFGVYDAALCITSNDPVEPLVVIDVRMYVFEHSIYLPVISRQP